VATHTSPQQSWNPGDPGGAHTGRPRNGMGIAALVLGLIALASFWTIIGGVVLGLLAIVFGIVGYRRKKRGEATNGAMSLIGAITGALALVISSVLIAAGVSFLNSEEFDTFEECVKQADSASERQQCENDFRDDLEQQQR